LKLGLHCCYSDRSCSAEKRDVASGMCELFNQTRAKVNKTAKLETQDGPGEAMAGGWNGCKGTRSHWPTGRTLNAMQRRTQADGRCTTNHSIRAKMRWPQPQDNHIQKNMKRAAKTSPKIEREDVGKKRVHREIKCNK